MEIAVKEERIPEVKTEMEMDIMPYELDVHPVSTDRAQILSLQNEKAKLINDLVSLKAENQDLHLKLHNQQRAIDDKDKKIAKTDKHIAELVSLKAANQDLQHKIHNQQRVIGDKNAKIAKTDKILLI